MRILKVIMVMVSLCPLWLWAQKPHETGDVKIIQDESVSRMMGSYTRINKNNPEFDGYRVQIFFESGSNSKRLASEARDVFISRYPDVKAYLLFKAPYYLVRVGNFRNMNEAVGFQKKIVTDYPNAFPVKDKISYKEMQGN